MTLNASKSSKGQLLRAGTNRTQEISIMESKCHIKHTKTTTKHAMVKFEAWHLKWVRKGAKLLDLQAPLTFFLLLLTSSSSKPPKTPQKCTKLAHKACKRFRVQFILLRDSGSCWNDVWDGVNVFIYGANPKISGLQLVRLRLAYAWVRPTYAWVCPTYAWVCPAYACLPPASRLNRVCRAYTMYAQHTDFLQIIIYYT